MKTPIKIAALAALLAFGNSAMAQSGTWTNITATGTWSDTLMWLNNVPADGAGNTADFASANLTAGVTVSLDSNRTIGKLLFADTAPNYFGYTISPASTVLTLDNGGPSPIISVSNATSTIIAPLAGVAGFTKVGPSQLTLSGTNTITGGITVNGGTLLINAVVVSPGATNLTLVPQDLTISAAAVNLNDAANQGATMQEWNNLTVNFGQSFLGQSRGANARGFYRFLGNVSRTQGGTVDVPNNDATRTQTFTPGAGVPTGIINSGGAAYLTGNGFVDWYGKAAAAPFQLSAVTYTASTATTLAGNANITTTNGTTLAANAGISSLRYALASNTVVNLNGFSLTNGGTLLTAAVTANNGLVITNGTLLPPPNQDVVLIQNGAGSLNVAATIADNGSAAALTKSAGGTVILSGANTFSGTTYLNAGTLQVGRGGTSGDLGNSALVVGQSGTLTFNRSDSVTFGGTITGAIGLTQAGTGSLTLTGNNTYTNVTTVSAGTLQLGNGGTTGSINNSARIANSGTVIFNRSDAVVFPGSITGTGKNVNQGSGSLTIGGGVSGSVLNQNSGAFNILGVVSGATTSVTNLSSGTLSLSGVNTYGGSTVIANGKLVLGAAAAISNSPAIVMSAASSVLDVSAIPAGFYLNGVGPVNQALRGSGVVTGTVNVVTGSRVSPADDLVVGSLSFSNGLAVVGGEVDVDITSSAVLDQIYVGGVLSLTSGSFKITPTGGPLANGSYILVRYPVGQLSGSAANLSVQFNQVGSIADLDDSVPGQIRLIIASATPNNLTWAGGFSTEWDTIGSPNWVSGIYNQHDNVLFDDTASSFNVTLAAILKPGIVTVSNVVNSYTFTPTTPGNRLTGGASLVKDGAGSLTLTEVNDYTGPTVIKNGSIIVGDGVSSGNIGSGSVTNNGSLTFNLPDQQTVPGLITGTGALTKDGVNGTLVLSGNNDYSGATTITAGALQVGVGAASGTLGTGPVVDNGTLRITRSGAVALNNAISGTGVLVADGVGTVTVGGGNTYEGNTYISNGVVKLAASERLPSGGTTTGWLILDSSSSFAGTFDLAGFNQTINALSGIGGTVNGLITNSGASTTTTNVITVLNGLGNTYNGVIADAGAAGSKTRLVLRGSTSLRLGGASTYTGDTVLGDSAMLIFPPNANIGNNGTIIMSNGTCFNMLNNGGTGSFPGNTLVVPENSAAILASSQLGNGWGGVAIAPATSTLIISNAVSAGANTTKQFNGVTGVVQVVSGANLRFSSTSLSVNGSDNATFEVEGTLNTRNGTATGAGVSLGALTGIAGILGGSGNDGNAVFVIGAKGIDSTFSGTVQGVPPRGTSITKVGAGKLTLDGTLTYVGTTTVSNGVLKIASLSNPAVSLDLSPSINVASGAVLDLSDRGDGALNLGNSAAQTLGGGGTIRGSLILPGTAPGTINPGETIGTLTVTNVVTIGTGAIVNIEVNRTNVQTSDRISAGGAITITDGTLNLTNLGPDLITGDVFQVFNKATIGNFSITNLPGSNILNTVQYVWTNKLNIDGTLVLLQGVSPLASYSTNITATVAGSTITVSWPSTHLGWVLAAQTNSINVGLANNWVTNLGTASVTSTNFPINPANGAVFYRLVRP